MFSTLMGRHGLLLKVCVCDMNNAVEPDTLTLKAHSYKIFLHFHDTKTNMHFVILI